MNDNSKPTSSDSWDTYWRGTRDSAAFTSGGISHPAVDAFWNEFFLSVRSEFSSPRIIDIASGSGAVIERLQSVFDTERSEIMCLDISEAAVRNIEKRFPGVHGVVADATSTGLASEAFDIATSQYGVEYAGIEAIDEASRLVAVGGKLAFLLHYRGGAIFTECANSLDAIQRTQKADFITLAHNMFESGFRAVAGADRAEYEAAGNLLKPAIAELDAIFEEYGEHIAGDTIARLYSDVGRIHSEIQHYEASEVLSWLLTMQVELDAFAGRMQSMCDCALDRATVISICGRLQQCGFTVDECAELAGGDSPPLAWTLVASRNSSAETAAAITEENRVKFEDWTRQQIDRSVGLIMERRIFESPVVESKPVWSLPLQIMICQVREQGESHGFAWTISGEVPTDCLSSQAAATPRDAARHFAMAWQLAAARDPQADSTLADKAEYLFRIVSDDSLW